MQEIEKIQQEIKSRGIVNLLHFTKSGNLHSIAENGLVTRDRILSEYINDVCNDSLRLDKTDGICLSVSFPNYRMLYNYRMKNPEVSWVILRLDPAILWEKNCLFNYTNAASRVIREIPNNQREGMLGFNSMFSDLTAKREDLRIPKSYTTDPQAEIIVLEDIEKKFIKGYCVSRKDYSVLSNEFPEIEFNIINDFFFPRKDYNYWVPKKENNDY